MSIEADVQAAEGPATQTVQALAEAANCGDAGSLNALREALDQHPEIWRQVGDLAAHVEATWLRLTADGNALAEESIRREADRIREELLGASSTAMEKLLVNQIIACWLQLKHAEICAGSRRPSSLMQARFCDQRLERAQRRYFAAMKMLTQVRGLPLSALIPAKVPDSSQTADETPKNEVEHWHDPSLDSPPIERVTGAGTQLRILPESRKAV